MEIEVLINNSEVVALKLNSTYRLTVGVSEEQARLSRLDLKDIDENVFECDPENFRFYIKPESAEIIFYNLSDNDYTMCNPEDRDMFLEFNIGGIAVSIEDGKITINSVDNLEIDRKYPSSPK